MRKSLALKTLLRSPLKTLLTFLLVAAASFALFSRVTDYVITSREAAKAESLYHGVAAFDNSVEPVYFEYQEIETEPIPWPSNEQLQKFAELPGVTVADTRYATDGLIEDYKRVISKEDSYMSYYFVVEGTYNGYKSYQKDEDEFESEWYSLYMDLSDVKVLAGDINLDYSDGNMNIGVQFYMNQAHVDVDRYLDREYFDKLKKGSRYLVFGTYSESTGGAFDLGGWLDLPETMIEIDGLGEDYLETEEFDLYKRTIEAINLGRRCYDIVYTKDMRAIPYINERKLAISRGRALTWRDEGACVVSELFLDTYGLSVGDKIHIKLGDQVVNSGRLGTRDIDADDIPEFLDSAELEIIGAFRYNNEYEDRNTDREWRFGPATIFVPQSLFTAEVPDHYEIGMGQYSLFIEDPNDIEAFREGAEPMAGELNLAMHFSDGGWLGMKDSIQSGSAASLLTTVLYVLGAALALFLAVYLYVGRNQKSYAIMRTLGVPGRKAGNSLVLPLGVLSLLAMAFGGIAGIFYATDTVAGALAGMTDSSMPEGMEYVPDVSVPVDAVALCLAGELAFVFLLTVIFLWKMKKTPPLELMHEGKGTAGRKTGIIGKALAPAKHVPELADTAPVPAGLDLAKITATDEALAHGKYNAFRQVTAYIRRHMRRGVGKTAVSLGLTVVLTAGIGTFVLARLMYHDACKETVVGGRAMNFSSDSIQRLTESELARDVYYFTRLGVRVNAEGVASTITFTSDMDRYLLKDHKITYMEGYGWQDLVEGSEALCLVEQSVAEELGVSLGGMITMMSDDLYLFMPKIYEEDRLEAAIQRAGKPYKVVGILETEEEKGKGIFSPVNDWAQKLYGQPFAVGYCEFNLADNGKVTELGLQLEELKADGMKYARGASCHVDSEVLKSTMRTRDLLDSLFPLAVAAAVLIGLFGPGLVIVQLAQEAAFLRILGVTKKRARCMLILEQVVLCIVGIALVAAILALCGRGLFLRGMETLGFCWLLYFLGSVLGASAAAVQVTRHRLLELLQVK